MALPLSDQDMVDDVAAYFSSQKVTPMAVPDEVVSAGKTLHVAKKLTDQDIDVLSKYVAGLH